MSAVPRSCWVVIGGQRGAPGARAWSSAGRSEQINQEVINTKSSRGARLQTH